MKEQAIQAKILKWLAKEGYWTMKAVVSNKKGVPDILACSPSGRFVAIEVKAGKGKASRLQEHHLSEIRKAGGIALLVWSLEEVQTVLLSS